MSAAWDDALAEALLFRWSDQPLVTGDLAGTGGRLRLVPEDFVVTEIPSYLPEGRGSHLYLRVRKVGLNTRDLVLALLGEGLSENEVGVAGLKDKAAVTEQWLSLPNRHAAAVAALERLEGVTVLETSRHRNKLGIGHLRGNRFRVRIREVAEDAPERALAVVARLAEFGAPNYFGPQRFGRFGTNAVDGLKLVRGERVPGGHRLKRFFVAALQSRLFNAVLAERIGLGLHRMVVAGDWVKKHDSGGMFLAASADEASLASQRSLKLELSPALPLYGKKVRPSLAEAGRLEAEVFARFGLGWIDFASRRGDRRPSRVVVGDAQVERDEQGLVVSFLLPKGAYATTVLREITKLDVDEPLADPESGRRPDRSRA